METTKELLERDCGGANPIVKLASHLTKHKLNKQIDSGLQADDSQLVNEFLSKVPRFDMAPNTFSMDVLLHEMSYIERDDTSSESRVLHTGGDVSNFSNAWANQFLAEEVPWPSLVPEKTCEWTSEFLRNGSTDNDNLLAHEYLELIEAQEQRWKPDPVDSLKLLEHLEENDAIAGAARDLLNAVRDPKLEGTQFMQFMKQLSDGSVKIKDNEVTVKKDVFMTQQASDSWSEEFLTSSSVPEKTWADEFSEITSKEDTTLDTYYLEPDLLSDKWVEEFSKEHTEVSSDNRETQQEDFWKVLQSRWDQLAREDASVSNWLSDVNSFEVDSCYKDYTFHENNTLLDHPDPFNAAKEKLEAGDVPGSVLFFEAAVQKNPEHVEAWQYLGTTLADNEQEPEAIAALRRCLELDPANLTALLSLAVSFTNESLKQRACETLHDWLKHHPRYSSILSLDLANTHRTRAPQVSSFMSSDYHNALKDLFIKAVNISQDIDADLQIGLGVLFNLSSEFDKAIDCFNAALQLRPEDSSLWNKIGATLTNASRCEEAIDAFRQALRLSPGYIRTRYNIGVACLNLGVYSEAVGHFLSALQLQNSSSCIKNSVRDSSSRSVMSDNLWSSVKSTLSLMGLSDLHKAVDERDISRLVQTFSNDNHSSLLNKSSSGFHV